MTRPDDEAPCPTRTPPRAAAFIVTIYGDIVEPRGGTLGMASLIALCARAGLSETLVRTAVSRLVASGQLAGQRSGRRSFYGLTPDARAAFRAAARTIFRPPGTDAAEGWMWFIGPPAGARDALARAGFAEVAPGLWLGPDRELPRSTPPGGARMHARAAGLGGAVAALAARYWELAPHAARYRDFLAAFRPLAGRAADLPPARALDLRLRLVHDFRLALLGDPRLPAAALPGDWPGDEARRLFCRLYRTLTPAAGMEIAAHLEGLECALAAETPQTRARLAALAGSAPGQQACGVRMPVTAFPARAGRRTPTGESGG
jgi:phenylacetic acid degradation operon negative regulatory protein